MQRPKLIHRHISTALIIILGYALGTSVAGVFEGVLLHLRHLDFHVLTLLFTRAIHGYYLLWFVHSGLFDYRTHLFYYIVTLGDLLYGLHLLRQTKQILNKWNRQYEIRDGFASHGTSRWQTASETREFYHRDNRGFLLGDPKQTEYRPLPQEAFDDPKLGNYSIHPFTSTLNQQYLVFGPPGINKTTGFVLPNIFHHVQQGNSLVVTDPKSELYKLTSTFAREAGYNVIVLDYLFFTYGHRFNLLQYIETEADMAEFASMYLDATQNEGEKKDFWYGKAKELFTALIGFAKVAYGSQASLPHVYEHIADCMDPEYIHGLFKQYNVQGAPYTLLRGVLSAARSENTMAGILATLTEKLQLFTLTNVKNQCSASDFDLATVADKPTIVYVWMSDSQAAYAPLLAAFWTVLFNALYERARKSKDRLPIPLIPIIEEMGNIGKIGGLLTKLTTMRSRRIYPMMIWHNLPQFKLVYGDKQAEAILGACDTKVLLGCGELETAKYFSELLGSTTIQTVSTKGNDNLMIQLNSETQQYTGRKLMMEAELLNKIDVDDVLVFQRGRNPCMLKKVKYQHWKYQICPPDEELALLGQYPSSETFNIASLAEEFLQDGTPDDETTEGEPTEDNNSAVAETAYTGPDVGRFFSRG